MTINRVVAAALCAVGLAIVGCAKESPSLVSGVAEETFRAWLAKYDPTAERKENGIYLRFVERGTGTVVPTADKSWLRLNYTLYAMDGVVGETRSDKVAKLLDTWSAITHFVDDMLPYYSRTYSNYSQICEGLRSAFQYLRVGDSVRIYIPASLGYFAATSEKGMSVNSGYVGENTTGYLDRPCYFDVRVNEVIDDPAVWEQKMVERYVQRWNIPASDSVIRGVYMRVIQDNTNTTPITVDSSVRYYYATRFLDNHLIRTNVEKVLYQAKYLYSDSPAWGWSQDPSTFTPADFSGTGSQTDSTYRRVLAKVLPKAKSGQAIEFVTISAQVASGNVGQLNATPQILPYQPRRMQLRLLRWDEKEDQTKYDWKLFY